MAISITEVESGMGLLISGDVWIVLSYEHVKPGKGSSFVRIRVKNVKTHQVLERTFRSAESLDNVDLEELRLQYTYKNGNNYCFMDSRTFEEIVVPGDVMEDEVKFLQENLEVTGLSYKGEILKIVLPNFITTKVIQTEPGIRGDSSRAGNKPATIDTGATILVPLFIDIDTWIKIDTRSGEYVERANK